MSFLGPKCPINTHFDFENKTTADDLFPNSSTASEVLQVRDVRGGPKTFITSSRASEEARVQFGCPDLIGVELESTGGSGTKDLHLAKRCVSVVFLSKLKNIWFGFFNPTNKKINERILLGLTCLMFILLQKKTGACWSRHSKNDLFLSCRERMCRWILV